MHMRPSRHPGFTLIELLVVIAVVAVLAVVVLLALNPAELLRQARDSQRYSDLDTVSHALSVYSADKSGTSGFNLGSSTVVYVSVPDPSLSGSSTSTCTSLGLPALPAGETYQCVSKQYVRNTDGTGWIPVNFQSIAAGSPLGSLPIDPSNQTSTNLYYVYTASGTQYEVTAVAESQKQRAALITKSSVPGYPGAMSGGSSVSIGALFNSSGLVGYWTFDDGTPSSTADASGGGNPATWYGNLVSGSHYAAGRIGTLAGNFDGSTNYVNIGTPGDPFASIFSSSKAFSVFAWIYPANCTPLASSIFDKFGNTNGFRLFLFNDCTLDAQFRNSSTTITANGAVVPTNTWSFVGITRTAGGNVTFYLNGVPSPWGADPISWTATAVTPSIGYASNNGTYFTGKIDDVRVYSRSFSDAEAYALYNIER